MADLILGSTTAITESGGTVTFIGTGEATILVDYLVQAGGGGGGGKDGTLVYGGGGGAGGLRSSVAPVYASGNDSGFTTDVPAMCVLGRAYTITVGAGGASQSPGNNSVFAVTSVGGGRGSSNSSSVAYTFNLDGGSGGGGGPYRLGSSRPMSTREPGNGIGGQGYNGGFGEQSNAACGGGGGAGGAGGNGGIDQLPSGTAEYGGAGGIGITSTISGTSTTYGGGGAGNGYVNPGPGASHGGGNSKANSGVGTCTAGTNGKGGGGGGNAATPGAAGGSGVIVLKIPDTYTATFTGGVTASTTTASGFNIYNVTVAGTGDTVTFS